ncbi:NADPH-dependent FMN reductase [Bifidobacterium samirii]|uniref:NADPH-dependent FMN reductase n=1 Tax=Bifidobacterium samirii TaxID=2306974 RepID=A0A430FWT9_9BIFI|nr:NADPH-dependent FMN reductase [Bifidobacterium samirii]RSX58746.1 NADPH-dependent FMN reductase [Bifidobacterium samirii]
MTKHVTFIIGSLRKGSFNAQFATIAAEALAHRGIDVDYLDFADVPVFNQDTEQPTPTAADRVRTQVAEADALWVFSPEYNFSYPGGLKNLLDWLSRPIKPFDFGGPTPLSGKTVAIASVAGKSAGAGVRAKLAELFRSPFTNNTLIGGEGTGASLTPDAFATGTASFDEETRAKLVAQAEELAAAIAD